MKLTVGIWGGSIRVLEQVSPAEDSKDSGYMEEPRQPPHTAEKTESFAMLRRKGYSKDWDLFTCIPQVTYEWPFSITKADQKFAKLDNKGSFPLLYPVELVTMD